MPANASVVHAGEDAARASAADVALLAIPPKYIRLRELKLKENDRKRDDRQRASV